MRNLFSSLLLCLLGTVYLSGQSIQQVRAGARNDLKDSIERLALLRQQIGGKDSDRSTTDDHNIP